MKLDFKVSLPELEHVSSESRKVQKKILMKSMFKMQEIAVRKAPVDVGTLSRSIRIFPDPSIRDLKDEYYLVSGVDYASAVEYGTKPHFPPPDELKGWARRVLGDENAAYAVSKKISKKGTVAQPFFRPALVEVRWKHLGKIAFDSM